MHERKACSVYFTCKPLVLLKIEMINEELVHSDNWHSHLWDTLKIKVTEVNALSM